MSDDDFAVPLWRRLLVNRFVMTPLALAVIALGWNLWVATHDDGLVAGKVVDAAGRPVSGATVTLWAFNFTTFAEVGHTTTGPDGAFLFDNNRSHNIQLSADKPGVGRAARVPLRLYFRGQNVALDKPLTLVES